jgi:hypothetical protein
MLFYHKGLRGRKTPLPFVACARKAAILCGQIWSAHESDVVGLEGSCQAAIHPPYTTFDSFFRLRCARHTPPALRPQTHPCFPCCGVSCLCAAPVTHQAQGALTSRSRARRLPLARSVPQKTLGSLPCPIVYSVQISWLPRGSNFDRAHGRGVARLHNSGGRPSVKG